MHGNAIQVLQTLTWKDLPLFLVSPEINTGKSIFYLSQVILQNKLCNFLAITGTLWTNHVGLNAFHLRCHCHQVLDVAYCHTSMLYTMWKITTKNWIIPTKNSSTNHEFWLLWLINSFQHTSFQAGSYSVFFIWWLAVQSFFCIQIPSTA